MPNKVRINLPGGGQGDATPIDINQANEQWNTYLLDDGSTLRAKLVVTKVVRVDNQYAPDGNPVYIFQSQNICVVDAPDSLKKKA